MKSIPNLINKTPSNLISVDLDNFSTEVLEKSEQVPVLVDFTADWCGPCRILKPILHRLAHQANGQFIIAQVDTDEQQKLAGRYGIRSLPTLKLFWKGKIVEETLGVKSESVLLEMIHRHLNQHHSHHSRSTHFS